MTEVKKEHLEEENKEEEKIDEALQALLDSFSPDNFTLGQGTYKLVKNYREGFDYEATIKRYNDVLEKYDYVVGDWGYDQLRLKGFFMDEFKSAPIDAKISTLEDYLYEYCNFGCAYFVIQQTGEFKRRGRTSSGPKKNTNKPTSKLNNKSNNKPNNKPKNKAHTEEKRYSQNKNKKKPQFKSHKKGDSPQVEKTEINKKNAPGQKITKTNGKHQFTIRKKEEE